MMPSVFMYPNSHWYAHSYAYQSMLMLKTGSQYEQREQSTAILYVDMVWRRSLVCVHCIECDGKISTLSMRIVDIEVACRWNTQKPPQKMTRCAILSCASINTPIHMHIVFIHISGDRFVSHFSLEFWTFKLIIDGQMFTFWQFLNTFLRNGHFTLRNSQHLICKQFVFVQKKKLLQSRRHFHGSQPPLYSVFRTTLFSSVDCMLRGRASSVKKFTINFKKYVVTVPSRKWQVLQHRVLHVTMR